MLTFRLEDREYQSVWLASDLKPRALKRRFALQDGVWTLELPRPDGLDRLEYQFEVHHGDGGTEWIRDPHNPEEAPGAFGAKSVLLLPGYEPPRWLDDEAPPGRRETVHVVAGAVRAELDVEIWSPDGAGDGDELPLLLAHDGPEYDQLAGLTRFCATQIESGALPPHRVALLPPGDRDEWYAASALYARALTRQIIPALRAAVPVAARPAGMGASLGALAMLHAHRRHPGALGGLFLQSGSFFLPQFDAHEARFGRYQRISRFARATVGAPPANHPIPIAMTCGSEEENVDNNRVVAEALARRGYEVAYAEVADLHNYVAWRDAFDPHLRDLLRRAWP